MAQTRYHFCDKGLIGPSRKWSANNYVDIYEAYFHKVRDEQLNILEIGIGVQGKNWNAAIAHGKNSEGGASLKMWSDYFQNSNIYAIDINDASHITVDRTETFVVNQGEKAELDAFTAKIAGMKFDIIIDDGSHRADHQQISLEALFPYLKPDGYYIIEDLNDHGYGGSKKSIHSSSDTVSCRDFFTEFKNTGSRFVYIFGENRNSKTPKLCQIATLASLKRFSYP